VAESVGSALGFWKRQVDAAAPGGPPVTYESLVDDYSSETHRNHPGAGYPVGALAGDIARSDKRTRAAIGVARAVSGEHLSREILTTVAQVLKNPTS
jgi:TetR/AcrR family transcriptional regulator, transcriptional repressor for nem operon